MMDKGGVVSCLLNAITTNVAVVAKAAGSVIDNIIVFTLLSHVD